MREPRPTESPPLGVKSEMKLPNACSAEIKKTELAAEWRIDYLSSWREGLKFLLDLLNSREASLMLRLMLPS